MRDLLVLIFELIPFLVNLISILAGVLLWLWLIIQRRKRDAKRNQTT